MPPAKKEHPAIKQGLHPRNRHRERYNFKELIKSCPDLKPFVKLNDYQDESIDFFDPAAVKMLNKALLKHYYEINFWDIPEKFLCPPIPGRADYLHHAADLLENKNAENKIPTGSKIICLDIGVGANCVYPIIGTKEYGWRFIGSDIDSLALKNAAKIIDMNARLKDHVELRSQDNSRLFFKGIIKKNERIDLTICNPPFHSSLQEAMQGSINKLSNLKGKRIKKPVLNFGGQTNELWCEGGEVKFIENMIHESKEFFDCCFWFTVLVSKQSSLNTVYHHLKMVEAFEVKTLPMSHGHKTSRIVAWTFLNAKAQKEWRDSRWG